MGYYDFPHTRNYDTDLGYLIDKTKENTTNIASLDEQIKAIDVEGLKQDVAVLETDNTKNKNNITSLQSDNSTNKSNIATNTNDITNLKVDNTTNKSDIAALKVDNTTNKSDIATLKTNVNTNTSNINSNTTKIKALEDADYLKLVGFLNSENVTITDHGKVDGKQTFTINVTGTTPVNLSSNVNFFNNNPQQPIISLAGIELDASTNVIKLTIYNYKNGEMDSTESSIKLSTDEFKIVDDTLTLNKSYVTTTTLEQELEELTTTFNTAIATKQNNLVSGTNIKTINGSSVLGSGDLTIESLPPGGVKNNLLYKKSETDGDAGWTSITTDKLLTQDNIVNNLTSSSTTNVLGAGQGKVLNDKLDNKLNTGVDVTGTLSAGSTSITLQLPGTYTNTNVILDYYTSVYGTYPSAVDVALSESIINVTLTFSSQDSDLTVAVKVIGTY
jgi:hypothetical protein